MEQTRGERRAETARQNDNGDIITAAGKESPAGERQQGSEGGNLQTDLGSRIDEERATDPNRHESVTKGDHIDHGQGERPPQPRTQVVSERG